MKKILILGAGMSGLCAARQLQSDGHEVVLVDKGRGIGGRMATRRFEGGTFDHGAQFFTARSDEFKALLSEWEKDHVAGKWFEGYPSLDNEKPDDKHPRFRGEKGMTGIGKYLAQGLDVHLGEEIERLAFNDGRWTAFSKSGANFEADELVLTSPVPQSLALLRTAGVELPDDAKEKLENLRYEPCFAVLVNLSGPSLLPAPGALYVNGEVLWWLADNFQKGISPRQGSVTIHSSGPWAKAHYDDAESDVAAALLEVAAPYLGASVESSQVRRWRYSKPENPLEIGSLRVRELNLSFAGDIFQGAKIEGAALSGLSAARAISEQ
jgi:predicted NAD/FAD-dependent oxidoreductase